MFASEWQLVNSCNLFFSPCLLLESSRACVFCHHIVSEHFDGAELSNSVLSVICTYCLTPLGWAAKKWSISWNRAKGIAERTEVAVGPFQHLVMGPDIILGLWRHSPPRGFVDLNEADNKPWMLRVDAFFQVHVMRRAAKVKCFEGGQHDTLCQMFTGEKWIANKGVSFECTWRVWWLCFFLAIKEARAVHTPWGPTRDCGDSGLWNSCFKWAVQHDTTKPLMDHFMLSSQC